MATVVLGVAGAAIGSYWGPAGAKWGWSIGTMIGGLIDQPKFETGKIYDRRISSSAYGSVIPKLWGYGRLGGTIVWAATDANGNVLIQHQHSSGGSGGGGTTDTYSTTIAVAYCKGTIYKRDPSNPHGGTLVTRHPNLVRQWANDLVVYDSGDSSLSTKLVLGSNLFWHNGGETGNGDSIITAAAGSQTTSYPGIAYEVIQNWDLTPFGQTIPMLSAEIATDDCTLADVISDLAGECGLLAGDLDVSEVTSIPIKSGNSVRRGVLVADTGTPDDDLRSICAAFQVDRAELDSVIRFVPRGGSVVLTVPWGDLGAMSGKSHEGATRLERADPNPIDLPGRVELTYLDPQRHYQQAVHAEQRSGFWPQNVEQLSIPMVLTEGDAIQIATQWLDMRWIEAPPYKFSLPPQYLWLATGDPITLTREDGSTVRLRIVEFQPALFGEIKVDAVPDDPDMLSVAPQNSSGGGSGNGSVYSPGTVPVTFEAWSGTELQDADQSAPGFYVAGWWPSNGNGGQIYYSTDGGSTWTQCQAITQTSTFGTTTTTLANGTTAGSIDTTHTVTVDVSETMGVLSSASASQIQSGTNSAVCGPEILAFETPTLNSDGTYTISNILRGLRNSPMTGHSTGENFVMATRALVRVTVPWSLVGTTIKVIVLAANQTYGQVTPVNVTIATPTAAPVAPTSISEAIAYKGATEYVTFTPQFTTQPTGNQTYNWQTRTSTDGVTWGSWSSTTNTPGAFTGPGFTSGYIEAQCQSVISNGQTSVWVLSASVQYGAPPTGSTNGFVIREVPSGAVNGSNTAFTLVKTAVLGLESVYLNGRLMESGSGNDYTIANASGTTTITMATAPASTDVLLVSYYY